MEEELDAETLKKGGLHTVCPICFEKKKYEESYFTFCCGQDICITCGDSYKELTCEYCRAEVLSDEENDRLLKKRGSNHVCII
jgi:hypothetical protein